MKETVLGGCPNNAYSLVWDRLCFRTCQGLRGISCLEKSQEKFCSHAPECPALCRAMADNFCQREKLKLLAETNGEKVLGNQGKQTAGNPNESGGESSTVSESGAESESQTNGEMLSESAIDNQDSLVKNEEGGSVSRATRNAAKKAATLEAKFDANDHKVIWSTKLHRDDDKTPY